MDGRRVRVKSRPAYGNGTVSPVFGIFDAAALNIEQDFRCLTAGGADTAAVGHLRQHRRQIDGFDHLQEFVRRIAVFPYGL